MMMGRKQMLPWSVDFQHVFKFFGESGMTSSQVKLSVIQQSLVDATDSNLNAKESVYERVQDRRRHGLLVFDV
jgi:hypothetical protein